MTNNEARPSRRQAQLMGLIGDLFQMLYEEGMADEEFEAWLIDLAAKQKAAGADQLINMSLDELAAEWRELSVGDTRPVDYPLL